MNTIRLITAAAIAVSSCVAMAAEGPNDDAVKAQPAPLQRAEVIAETKRAMASGELKFGPLVDYQAQFAPAPVRAPEPVRVAERRRTLDQRTVALDTGKQSAQK